MGLYFLALGHFLLALPPLINVSRGNALYLRCIQIVFALLPSCSITFQSFSGNDPIAIEKNVSLERHIFKTTHTDRNL